MKKLLEKLNNFDWDTEDIEEIDKMISVLEDSEEEIEDYIEYLKNKKRDIKNGIVSDSIFAEVEE